MSKIALIALLGAALLPSEAPAANQYEWLRGGTEQVVTTMVSHADLDLTRPDHAAELKQRVRRAAERICTEDSLAPLEIVLDAHRCVRNAIRNANVQIARAKRDSAQQLAQRSAR